MDTFIPPTATEQLLNRVLGFVVGLGVGPADIVLLEVRGRTTGRLYVTPVDVLALGGRRYLVAPRGQTAWVRNAGAVGTVALRKGRRREACRVRALAADEKPAVLRAYLDRFTRAVQRYFPVPAGSPERAFTALADRYPVFELLPVTEG